MGPQVLGNELRLPMRQQSGLDGALDAGVSGVKLVACCATCAAVEANAFCPPTTFAVVAYELAFCTIESGL